MTDGGSMLTLTYYGAEKSDAALQCDGRGQGGAGGSVRYLAADLGVKNIRVNAISAGPIKTMAASGIGDFRYILRWNEYNSPLRRVVTIEEVGETAVYLLVADGARRLGRSAACRRRLSCRGHDEPRRRAENGGFAGAAAAAEVARRHARAGRASSLGWSALLSRPTPSRYERRRGGGAPGRPDADNPDKTVR